MKTKLLIIVFLLYCLPAFTQQSTLEQRLKASKVENYILIKYMYTTNKLQYEIDPKCPNLSKQHVLDDEPEELIAKNKKLKITLAFINPIAYNISYKIKNTEDDIYKNIKSYTNNISQFLKITLNNKEQTADEISQYLLKKLDIDPNSENSLVVNNNAKIKNIKLAKSYLELDNWLVISSMYDEKDKMVNVLGNDFNKLILEINDLLYSDTTGRKDNNLYSEVINKDYNNLKSIIDYKKFVISFNQFNDHLKLAIDANNLIVGKLNNFKKTYFNKGDDIAKKSLPSQAYYYYTLNVIEQFNKSILEDLDNQVVLYNGYLNLLKELNKLDNYYDKERDAFCLEDIAIKQGVTTKFTLIVEPNKDEKVSPATCTFSINNYSFWLPELSLGANFTRFSTNSYGVSPDSTGSFVVTSNANLISNVGYMGMFNFLPSTAVSNLYPMIQVGGGFSAPNNKIIPVVGIGGGLRLFYPLDMSLSVGYVWHWDQTLNSYNLGEKVKSSDLLTNDLTYTFNPNGSLYLGIHFNLGKK